MKKHKIKSMDDWHGWGGGNGLPTRTAKIKRRTYFKGVRWNYQSPTHWTKKTYTPGTTVIADGFNKDPWEECGAGISFCNTYDKARQWAGINGKVVEIKVLSRLIIAAKGGKLRARRVKVLREVSA